MTNGALKAWALSAIFAGLAVVFGIGAAQSADVSQCVLYISGEVTSSTVNEVKWQYSALNSSQPETCGPKYAKFDSGGGDIAAAIQIGEFLREKQVSTIVPEGAACASACVLAFVGGVYRLVVGRLGIHRPYGMKLSTNQTDSKRSFESINEVVKKHLANMNVSAGLLAAMNSVSPGKIKWLTRDERINFQVQGADPVWEDARDSGLARKLGISKRELYERERHAERQCRGISDVTARVACEMAIIHASNTR